MRLFVLVPLLGLAAFAVAAQTADPLSDAPEHRFHPASFTSAASYPDALAAWRTPEDVNAWIGARFEYNLTRAMRLSETQRENGLRLPIHEPEAFFADPSGVCVDLARFAVETLRRVDPGLEPRYLMIEFAPVAVGGNTLRLHWLASFMRDGGHHFFADSKRPGHIAGPYASVQEFVDQYGAYRGRQVVVFRELDSWQRRQREFAARQSREERR